MAQLNAVATAQRWRPLHSRYNMQYGFFFLGPWNIIAAVPRMTSGKNQCTAYCQSGIQFFQYVCAPAVLILLGHHPAASSCLFTV